MANTTPTGIAAHIAVVGGIPTTTTQDIAEVYGKRHDDVLKIVRQRMIEAGEWGVRNFSDTPYTNPQNGQTYPVIRMTRKGFHFVVGKFTGAKAVRHQIAYADEFDRMESELQARPAPIAQPTLRSRRWLICTDAQGAETVQPIGPDDFVASWAGMVKDIAGGECLRSSAELVAMANACTARLHQRMSQEASRANAVVFRQTAPGRMERVAHG